MLTEVAEGVLVRPSAWCETNTVVVRDGAGGALVVDPGIHQAELDDLVADLAVEPLRVVAGFSTHPHWDHLLWVRELGEVPRYATGRAAEWARQRLAGGIDAKRFGIPDDTPLDLMGSTTPLPEAATQLPWGGPDARIIEHRAHAPGHAALLLGDARTLVAGDMLSDVLMPMLDLMGDGDPIGDYLDALHRIAEVVDRVDVVIPGHGSIGDAQELRRRLDRDRAYVEALRDGRTPDDPRIGPDARPGWEWVADVHARQVGALVARS